MFSVINKKNIFIGIIISSHDLAIHLYGRKVEQNFIVVRGLKLTSVKKATNQTPFFASMAILENNFLIRSGCLFLNHLDVPLKFI